MIEQFFLKKSWISRLLGCQVLQQPVKLLVMELEQAKEQCW